MMLKRKSSLLVISILWSVFGLTAGGVSTASAAPQMVGEIVQGSGPYGATFLSLPDLPSHVVYLPRDLNSLGERKLGIYIYGNGGCSADGLSSRNHLLEIASHGYVAIAPGVIPGPNREIPQPLQLPNGKLSADTPSSALKEALDWVIAENVEPNSMLNGLIDTNAVAVSGWSCGGLQAIEIGSDPRVKTAIIMNSGVFNDEGAHIEGINVKKSSLQSIKVPVLYVLGGKEDGAQPNGLDDFNRLNHVKAAVVDIPVGHGGTFHEKDGGTGAEVVVFWLEWTLNNKSDAAKKYEGADCGYCHDARFQLTKKNID